MAQTPLRGGAEEAAAGEEADVVAAVAAVAADEEEEALRAHRAVAAGEAVDRARREAVVGRARREAAAGRGNLDHRPAAGCHHHPHRAVHPVAVTDRGEVARRSYRRTAEVDREIVPDPEPRTVHRSNRRVAVAWRTVHRSNQRVAVAWRTAHRSNRRVAVAWRTAHRSNRRVRARAWQMAQALSHRSGQTGVTSAIS
jgi:hypothetical protein